jgi:tetratricopeptide (TPR) repeat protein
MEHEREVRSRPARLRRTLFFILTLVVLSIATAWNLTRSEALAEAERAYARGDLVGCLQYALEHLGRRPWSREAALLAARCLSRRDFAEQAEPYYRRAGRLSLNDQQVRAYFLVRGPHPEHAIPAYREILRLAPDNVTAMRRLAAVLLVQADKDQLLELADRLDRVRGGEVVGAMLRGTVYHNDENPQRAVASFERVLELDPELNEMPASRKFFWNQLAGDLIECGRIEDAARYLERALSISPNADLINLIGYTDFLRGNLDEAERRYHQAAEMDASLYGPHLALAKLALQRRRYDEALRELDEARRLAPRRYGVLYSLVLLYKQLGRDGEAAKVQAEIKEVRQETAASSSRAPNAAWPRYAL